MPTSLLWSRRDWSCISCNWYRISYFIPCDIVSLLRFLLTHICFRIRFVILDILGTIALGIAVLFTPNWKIDLNCTLILQFYFQFGFYKTISRNIQGKSVAFRFVFNKELCVFFFFPIFPFWFLHRLFHRILKTFSPIIHSTGQNATSGELELPTNSILQPLSSAVAFILQTLTTFQVNKVARVHSRDVEPSHHPRSANARQGHADQKKN